MESQESVMGVKGDCIMLVILRGNKSINVTYAWKMEAIKFMGLLVQLKLTPSWVTVCFIYIFRLVYL